MHEIPAILKVLILFTAIVVLYRLKLPLWAALLSVSLASGLWFGVSALCTLEIMGRSAISPDTLFLGAVVVLIMGFSTMMREAGVLERIVKTFGELLGSTMFSAAALPALIGLLPMPGGAIFSAPMVEASCSVTGPQTPEQKSAVNYWFRHIWEYWWPLYPGVILASHLFSVSTWRIMFLHLPMTIAAVLGGYWFVLRKAFPSGVEREKSSTTSGSVAKKTNGERAALFGKALTESACIIIVIASIFIFGPLMEASGIFNGISVKYWPVIAGFILGIAWLALKGNFGLRKVAGHIFAREQFTMLLLAAGVMVFRDVLVGVDAFTAAQRDLELYNVPVVVVIAALPFLAGLVMGLAIGFVGASFPLVISLLPPDVMAGSGRFAYLVLAYTFGYMGMMMSPVHFCLVMTKDYFHASFAGIYRLIIPPALVVAVAGLLAFALYSSIF